MTVRTARLALCLATGLVSLAGWAQSVDIARLGQLRLEYAAVSTADSYAGRPVAALAGHRAGESVSLITDPRVQQIHYLLPPGATVEKGQPIARLDGPEVHHFLLEVETTGKRLALARQRFLANRELYRSKAIDESRWIMISDTYYALKLEHEHLRHFHSLLVTGDRGDDGERDEHGESVTLIAPAGGVLDYAVPEGGISAGGELASIIPAQSLRLKVEVPLARRADLVSLSSGSCRLGIADISGIAEGFRVSAWSNPLTSACDFLPGQRFMVTPWYRAEGFRVPVRSLLQWRGRSAVLVREDGHLVPVPVEVLGGTADDYFVRCDADLDGREVLTHSVSALQGILLGLGAD
jgi:hypothetical protein